MSGNVVVFFVFGFVFYFIYFFAVGYTKINDSMGHNDLLLCLEPALCKKNKPHFLFCWTLEAHFPHPEVHVAISAFSVRSSQLCNRRVVGAVVGGLRAR